MRYIANPVLVDAYAISAIQPVPEGGCSVRFDNGEVAMATKEMCVRYFPVVGDYWVVQSDGYFYLNPKAVFERKYRPLE